MLDDILRALDDCRRAPDEPIAVWVRPYETPEDTAVNQFIVMLKPELAAPEHGPADAAVALALDVLAEHGVHIGGVRVLSSSFLDRNHVIPDHYPTLYGVSRHGVAAMSAVARTRLAAQFPDLASEPGAVLGAHEFLDRVPEFTPYALEVLTRNVEVTKLGTGTYAIRVRLDDEERIVLNPFHPMQLLHFTDPGRAAVLMACTSARHLGDIRRDTIGATDPREAVPGSLRHIVWRQQRELGLHAICTRRNAVHMSPGPVEGMVAVRRYFSAAATEIPAGRTAFGARLLAAGHGDGVLFALQRDPEIETGALRGPLFEVTEDMNWDEALGLVGTLVAAGRWC